MFISLIEDPFFAYFVLLAVNHASGVRLPALQLERTVFNRKERIERIDPNRIPRNVTPFRHLFISSAPPAASCENGLVPSCAFCAFCGHLRSNSHKRLKKHIRTASREAAKLEGSNPQSS